MTTVIEAPARSFTRADAEAFLYREARALDDKDWDAWLACYAADAEFWVGAFRLAGLPE